MLNGPPLPAPPSFTGLALAGLAALGLMEDHPDADTKAAGERYPGYDVLAKRHTPVLERADATRDRRAGWRSTAQPRFFTRGRIRRRVSAIATRIVPQPADRAADPGRGAGRRQAAPRTARTAIGSAGTAA